MMMMMMMMMMNRGDNIANGNHPGCAVSDLLPSRTEDIVGQTELHFAYCTDIFTSISVTHLSL